MNKTVYSLYIDIPTKDLDNQNPYFWDNISKSKRTKIALKQNYKKLLDVKKKYCQNIGVDFHMFEHDQNYIKYEKFFKDQYPQITTYNIINFYKLHLMYELAKDYDQILYLDFDVVPCTDQSFFDVWDLSKGICLLENNKEVNKRRQPIDQINHSVRSPTAKFFNAQAMLHDQGYGGNNDVINTGIIGASKKHLQQLKYFDALAQDLDVMQKLTEEYNDTIYPPNIVKMFGYDNETLISYKIQTNNVPVQWLDAQWHYFYDAEMHIPQDTKMIHAVNKKFDFVWRFYEKCNF
tara:strand:- start:84 stop:959 length:876 start_codon:yes stop_codon:yes gene_type:complete